MAYGIPFNHCFMIYLAHFFFWEYNGFFVFFKSLFIADDWLLIFDIFFTKMRFLSIKYLFDMPLNFWNAFREFNDLWFIPI